MIATIFPHRFYLTTTRLQLQLSRTTFIFERNNTTVNSATSGYTRTRKFRIADSVCVIMCAVTIRAPFITICKEIFILHLSHFKHELYSTLKLQIDKSASVFFLNLRFEFSLLLSLPLFKKNRHCLIYLKYVVGIYLLTLYLATLNHRRIPTASNAIFLSRKFSHIVRIARTLCRNHKTFTWSPLTI